MLKNVVVKLYRSMKYSFNGLQYAWSEFSIRLEWIALVLGIGVCIYVRTTWKQTFFLLAAILFVIVVELLNSAIEQICDLVQSEHHPMIGRTKDMGSAAVFLAIIMAIGVWCVVLV